MNLIKEAPRLFGGGGRGFFMSSQIVAMIHSIPRIPLVPLFYKSAHEEQRVMLTPSPIQQAGNSSWVKAQWKACSLVWPAP